MEPYCCFCIPSKTAILILGFTYIMTQLYYLATYNQVLSAMTEEENEDEENIKQKQKILDKLFWVSIVAGMRLILGAFVIIATTKEIPTFMKICSVCIIGNEIFGISWTAFNSTTVMIVNVWPLAIALSAGILMWSYADYLAETPLMVTVDQAPPDYHTAMQI